ncbi:MAG: hypothetical protein QW371_01055 [Candidatus Bathyarchaeia archaeon]
MSLSEGLIEGLERDPRARKRIAELLVIEPDIGLAMINALRAEIAQLRAGASSNFRWRIGTILILWARPRSRSC